MKPSPEKIIEAFDVCLVYVYGYRDARDNPHKTDMETATKWVEAGLSVEVACFVFFDRMNWMHEKHLKFHSKSDRTNIPTCLKVFDENIEVAIRRAKGEHFDMWENNISLWRARYKGWLKNKAIWRKEMWGPAPDEKCCRVPKEVFEHGGSRSPVARLAAA